MLTEPVQIRQVNTCSGKHVVQAVEDYLGLLDDLSASAKRWQEWVEMERPEEDVLPGA